MRIGTNAWSMQYHVEIEPDTVANWGAVPAYRDALEAALGADALERMRAETDAQMSSFLTCAETLYRNFMMVATGRRSSSR